MAHVYLETSFVSACVSSRNDAASVYRRQASTEWMQIQSPRHDLFVSAEVIAELSHPSYRGSTAARELIRDVPLLALDAQALGFARLLVQEKVMPAPVGGDAVHIAAACIHRIDYVLSWNVRHLANPNKLEHLRVICLRAGLLPPRIVTPELLWEDAS